MATKFSGVVSSYGLDEFFQNGGTGPKQVFNVAGGLVWTPHNLFLNSETPATQNITTIVGAPFTIAVTGSGSVT